MKSIFFCFLLLITTNSFAQQWGATVGITSASVESSGSGSELESFDSSLGYDLGALYEHELMSGIILSTQLGYTSYKSDVTIGSSSGELTFSYLVIRPLFHYMATKELSLIIGATLGLVQTSEAKAGAISLDYDSDPDFDVNSRVGLNIGVGYLVLIEEIQLRPKLMYELALTDALEEKSTDYTGKTNSLVLSVDVLF